MGMEGIGKVTGPQLMAEVGDVRRFSHKGALVAYAGVDASPYQSGSFDSKSRHVSKRGSPHLRRVLFVIMSMTLIRANTAKNVAGPFVCQFLILHFSSFVHDTYLQVCCVTILPF